MKKNFTITFLLTSLIIAGQTKSLLPNKTLKDSVFVTGDIIKIPDLFFNLCYPIYDETVDSLKPVADFLKRYPALIVEIGCHTDMRGSVEDNRTLSEFRAKHAWEYLVNVQGIDSARLKYKGYGEMLPLIEEKQIKVANTKQEKEYLFSVNRRTELKVMGTK